MADPTEVFVPYQTVRHQLARRLDLPIFTDPKDVRTYLTLNQRRFADQRLTWTESKDPRDINAYLVQQARGKA